MTGACAAGVDTRTGSARTVATGVQLAYFNPGCGPDDRALLPFLPPLPYLGCAAILLGTTMLVLQRLCRHLS